MIPSNDKIIVCVNDEQKNKIKIGNIEFQTATKYETNYREKSPVIAEVVYGNEKVQSGDLLLCHHNLFYHPSPHHLYNDFFSIKFNKIIFAKIQMDGSLLPICGNLLCDRVDIETAIPLPPEQREQYTDRVVVTNPGYTQYKKGQLLFTRPYSYYEIVYVLNGVEKRVHKCDSDMVLGYLKD